MAEELPRFTRLLRAKLRLEIQRNIKHRNSDSLACKLWHENQQKRYAISSSFRAAFLIESTF